MRNAIFALLFCFSIVAVGHGLLSEKSPDHKDVKIELVKKSNNPEILVAGEFTGFDNTIAIGDDCKCGLEKESVKKYMDAEVTDNSLGLILLPGDNSPRFLSHTKKTRKGSFSSYNPDLARYHQRKFIV